MNKNKKDSVDAAIEEFNKTNKTHILHVNTTFETLAQGIQDVLTERDYEIQDVLDDFIDYCHNDSLIVVSDSWKKMRMQLAGTTFDFNVKENVYYDNLDRGFSAHDYLSLYKQKSVRAVGKLEAIITAVEEDGKLNYNAEMGELTEERKKKIDIAREDAKNYGYVLDAVRYFFVDKFYETDFPKVTPRPPMGTRIFDLSEILQTDTIPDTKTIAEELKHKSWT